MLYRNGQSAKMMHGKGRLCFFTFHERKWFVRVAAFVVYFSRDIDIWFV